MTPSGMSSHGSNGRGLTVSTTGHLMVVETSDIGAAVERRSTVPLPVRLGGALWQTPITAVTSAHIAASRRSLVAITPPRTRQPLRGVYKSRAPRRTRNENLF